MIAGIHRLDVKGSLIPSTRIDPKIKFHGLSETITDSGITYWTQTFFRNGFLPFRGMQETSYAVGHVSEVDGQVVMTLHVYEWILKQKRLLYPIITARSIPVPLIDIIFVQTPDLQPYVGVQNVMVESWDPSLVCGLVYDFLNSTQLEEGIAQAAD